MEEMIKYSDLVELGPAYALWRECGIRVDDPGSPREEGWTRYFDQSPCNFIAAYGSESGLVGTCVIFHDGRKSGIYRLAVRPSFQSRGIAGNLLLLAEAKARAAGTRGLYALVEEEAQVSFNLFKSKDYTPLANLVYFTKSL